MKAIISGAGGRMGRALMESVKDFPEIEVVGLLEKADHPAVGKEIGGIRVSSSWENVSDEAEVIIEFTSPRATLEHLSMAREKKISMVIGTTGFSGSEREEIREAGKTIPILFSSNMSFGMNLLFHILEEVSKKLPLDYEVEIVEMHHRHKKDAPSGTALTLGEIIASARGKDLSEVAVFGREGETGERKREEIGIHALRGGSVVGEHRVIFATEGERLEFAHTAESRLSFARGAWRGALWLIHQPPGLYSFQDIIVGK
ncbi:MAG: 4-hydroxy-tetrahydrodipicolinate reductase [Caldiserica bacterium]|nr:4-hydroxy-tetrahydrodipicolinate reductase [Caldisericota bacterium]